MLNLAMVLDDAARRYPEREAIVAGPDRLSYGEVSLLADGVASRLGELGTAPGDRVALSAPNVPEFVTGYFGILRAGAVVVPLNPRLPPAEVAWHLEDAGAEVLLAGGPVQEMAREGFDMCAGCREFVVLPSADQAPSQPRRAEPPSRTILRSPEDTAVVLYTSGTTGRPKGAELTHANLLFNAFASRQITALAVDLRLPQTRLIALPLFHAYGQTAQMNAGFLNADRLVLVPRFNASEVLELFEREQVSLFAGVPTMYHRLLRAAVEAGEERTRGVARHLRVCNSGGSAMPVELLRRIEARFGVMVLEGYGLSETSPTATINPPDGPRKEGSVGLPIFGSEVAVVDPEGRVVATGEVGEVVIRGHNVMKGYLNRPEATAAALRGGWFHTGDLGRLDADGYLFLVGRSDDMISRGGQNIHPREVEQVIEAHPAVRQAAVVGVPHVDLGEAMRAFVVTASDARAGAGELITWCREHLAPHKVPEVIDFVSDLPVTETGKLLRRELRTNLEGGNRR